MEFPVNSQISSDPETKGFDLSAGKTWIYPENYSVRDYQFNIVEASLYSNTLVCLPTGLGKTFIAAVVMYNFWRWYPYGKVVFLAPTKPLVAQQIFACHNTMGIPSTETIELTGAVNQRHREVAWVDKRVVFATPQVFHNDLDKNLVPADLVKCIVIDEAHKALGKHSYCECVHILSEKNTNFRVLALSATPGNKIDNVHEVLQNLHIAHVELRDETSSDIVPYINQRKIDIILVPLDSELARFKERYIFIMDRHVKILLQYNVLRGQTANISKGRVFHLLKEFQKKTNRSGNYGQIIKTLNILMTMYHAYELMVRDGLRAFHKFYGNHSDKFWMNEEVQLQDLLIDIERYLGPFPDVRSICEETVIPDNLVFGHTKFEKLKELLQRHFAKSQEKNSDTRAIVFVEYRDIVSEVYILLSQCRPLIRPQMFVGQAGQKQKQQIKALESFRSNHVNVLISTSIGEEGLDVGEVDLIICFDVSQHSPTRLVQRMGRTGRKRDGHIIILVTDGKEHETLRSTMARRDSLNNKILNTSNIHSSLYQNNPRMIPDIFTPECLRMRISVQPKSPVAKGKNKKEKLDKKNHNRQNNLKKVIPTDTNIGSPKNDAKFSLMKFFKSEKLQEHDTLQALGSNVSLSNNCNAVKPTDVKILSRDNDAVDFLTLCAIRNSEKETDAEEKPIAVKSYISEFASSTNFFNFSIPDAGILDCLTTLNDAVSQQCGKKDTDNNNDRANDSNDNDWHNDNCDITNFSEVIDNKHVAGESRFEDLLDDSSESSECGMVDGEEEINENNSVHSARRTGNDDDERYPGITLSKKPMENTTALEDLEPGMFEELLDESSDDSESNTNMRSSRQQKWIENIDGSCNTTETSVSANDKKIISSIKFKDARSQLGTIEFSDDFAKPFHRENDVSNFSESKNQTMLSITQAIDEIARLNSDSSASKVVEGSEDDIFQENCESNHMLDMDEWTHFDDANTIVNANFNDTNTVTGADFETAETTTGRDFGNDKALTGKTFKEAKSVTGIEFEDAEPASGIDLEDAKTEISSEVKIEDYDWDDEFEVSVDPVENCSTFNVTKKPADKAEGVASDLESWHSDTEDWISAEKSYNVSLANASSITIAKKLASVKKQFNDKHNVDERTNLNTKVRGMSFRREENEAEESTVGHKNGRRKLRRAKMNEFIDDEAEVSSNDSGDESSGADDDLDDFVSYTQNVHDTTDMHVHYLQTVRSPIKRHNAFLFKAQPVLDSDVEIYSQPMSQEESYINDSFCVGEEAEEYTHVPELSILEEAERELDRRKRKRARGDKVEDNARKKIKPNRGRRNVINECSSSEDETEKMRKQIQEESFLLARSKRERS